jgi:uncharacterized protein (TIRG00374 family)
VQAAPTRADQATSGLLRKITVSVLIAGLVFTALALYGDVQELGTTVQAFSGAAFALALALAACNYALRVVRWQYYLRRLGIVLPWGESTAVFLSGFVLSVTPGKVGEVFKSLLLLETHGTPITRTAPIVVAERLTDLIALVLLVSLGATAFAHGTAVALSSSVLVGFVFAVCTYKPLGYALLALADKLPLLARLSHRLKEAYDALLETTRPVPMLVGTALAFVAWGLECGSLYAVVRGFDGVSLTWDASVFAYSASTIAGAVAMMPGGLGVTEVGMTALLQTLGGPAMRPAVATTSTILVRIATLWFAVAIGAVALAAHRAFYAPGRSSVGSALPGSESTSAAERDATQ